MADLSKDAVKSLPRKFQYEGLLLDDFDPESSIEEVLALYSEHYPALVSAGIEGPEIRGDALVYKFVTQIGSKGAGKTPDFSCMNKVAAILMDQDEDDVCELPPSEALGLIG